MQSAIHNEFIYLANKMLLKHQSDNNVELDYGCVTRRRSTANFILLVVKKKLQEPLRDLSFCQ